MCQKVEMLGTQQSSACSLLLDVATGKLRFTETFTELCVYCLGLFRLRETEL